ncbi:MAG: preprotein translocase subunit SecE [Candidatus Pacebacteria bacterium]|jgi:preprotein translocase subunit SecE|nr:preprotein translocase subunit SecE [Candidatus Paceibacterota bacterium]
MKIKTYISEVRSEMRKVSWPTKEKTIKDSILVIVASLATAAFMGGADAIFSYLAEKAIVG